MTDEQFRQEAARLRPVMLATAARRTGCKDLSDDIVQEALLKMWMLRAQLNVPLDNFAKVLTRNLSIDLIRRQRHDERMSSDIPLCEDDSSDEQIERLMLIVSTLPQTWQIVLRLRHMEGMEYSDIAHIMQTSETAVRKMISRARQAVKQHYIRK